MFLTIKRDGDAKRVLTLSATKFKAQCLAVFDEREGRKLDRVVVTRRGKPVAELMPPRTEVPSLWGCMRGTGEIPPGVNLTDPVLEEPLDAELGILHR